jgi:hypothetical protein
MFKNPSDLVSLRVEGIAEPTVASVRRPENQPLYDMAAAVVTGFTLNCGELLAVKILSTGAFRRADTGEAYWGGILMSFGRYDENSDDRKKTL